MKHEEMICAAAAAHGFPLSGVAPVPADGRTPGSEAFLRWLGDARQGPLTYLAESAAQRVSIRTRFPWAQSLLCVGDFYDGRKRGQAGRHLLAHVARYGRGRDYHLVFSKRLRALASALKREKLCKRTHWYVDTGPVLERAWAAIAGLGWLGKNTCLIHPRHGSYLLLGEIILDVRASPCEPVPNHCGSCRRCLDACPTGALLPGAGLDATRCISTWNIEMKGVLPETGKVDLHGWVAGCDVCQEVCPFNAPSRRRDASGELADTRWQRLTLAGLIGLKRADYDRLFRASALRRAGWRGLRLSAIRAARGSKLTSVIRALKACAHDPDPEISRVAMEQLAGL